MTRRILGAVVAGSAAAAAAICGSVLASTGGSGQPSHRRIVQGHADIGVPRDLTTVTTAQLAARSLSVPGIRQALLIKVTGDNGAHRISSGSGTKIVTDYRIVVLKRWAKPAQRNAPTPHVLRIPGGRVGNIIETLDVAPTISVGSEYIVWDQTQPAAGAAGPSAAGVAVVPNTSNIATVDSSGNIDWAGKRSSIDTVESALTTGATH